MKINQLLEVNERSLEGTQPFLSKITHEFYRGTLEEVDEYALVQQREKDRKPLDTLHIAHKMMNEASKKKFGLNVRNLSFITMDREFASNYGEVCKVVPKGNFRLFCVENVNDIVDHYNIDGYNLGKVALKELIKNNLVDDNIAALNLLTANTLKRKEANNKLLSSESEEDLRQWVLYFNEYEYFDDKEKISEKLAGAIANSIMKHIEHETARYVDDIVEVFSDRDINSDMMDSEFMLYAPEGIYLINNE